MAINNLPEDCVSHILSLTSPKDACRLSAVSPLFRSASESVAVWDKFLPRDYREILSRRSDSDSDPTRDSMTRKALFFFLADNPIVLDNGTLSFRVEKQSGKKCFMVAARGLQITWGDSPEYWAWRSLPDSRFPEVAHLRTERRLDISARVETSMLSPDTTYGAYFIYKIYQKPVQLRVEFEGRGNGETRSVFLDPAIDTDPAPREPADGWMELEMGEFFNERGDDGIVFCRLKEVDDYNSKSGLVVEGIEFRPKIA